MTMRSPRKRAIILSALAVAVIALAVVFALPAFTTVAFVDPLLVQTFQLKELGRQLLAASDNDGRFPAKLADLVPDYAPEDWPGLKFHDLRTKEPIDWTYFSGHSTHDPGDTILVASPKTVSGADGTRMVGAGAFRIVLSTDDRLALLTEADFQACIADQQRPEWSIRQEIPVTWNFFSKHSGPSFARHGELEARARKNSPANVPHLIRVLQTGSEFDRQDAATALGEIGPVAPEIVPALITAPDVKPVGYWAAMALAEISLNCKAEHGCLPPGPCGASIQPSPIL